MMSFAQIYSNLGQFSKEFFTYTPREKVTCARELRNQVSITRILVQPWLKKVVYIVALEGI